MFRFAQHDRDRVNESVKRFFRIFELSKNEQRVVLIVMLVLLAIALVGYERRVHNPPVYTRSATEPAASPTPVETEDEH
jgi:hypothetical protein